MSLINIHGKTYEKIILQQATNILGENDFFQREKPYPAYMGIKDTNIPHNICCL